jgi:TPP-dependent pyruvate/acetoin dehydrogenase alpha subunit
MQKNNSVYEKYFYESLRIRLVEEKIIELYPSDKIQSPVHLSIGQESVAVTLCDHLKKDDWLFINYRGHACYLAKGGPLPELFAELYGKRTGLSKGKAGSMHLADPENGTMGASAVVGSTISHSVGAALASKIRGEDRIFVSIFGDGATEQGVYHESLNFASLHNLPVLFVCENNELAVHTTLEERQSYSVTPHAEQYNIKTFKGKDSTDFMGLGAIFSEALGEVRVNRRPVLVEVYTCRYKEHVGPGEDYDNGYRSEADINKWKIKDPLIVDKILVEKFTPKIMSEIDKAVEFAESSPYPSIDDLLTDVI